MRTPPCFQPIAGKGVPWGKKEAAGLGRLPGGGSLLLGLGAAPTWRDWPPRGLEAQRAPSHRSTPPQGRQKGPRGPAPGAFGRFALQLLEQSLRDEELRAQHRAALLRLREKALEEKARAELAWLEQQRRG